MITRDALIQECQRLLKDITPGEWSSKMPRRDDEHMCRITTDYDPQAKTRGSEVRPVIGMTWHPEHMVSYVGLTRQECIANARLFAAAPRLIRDLLTLIDTQNEDLSRVDEGQPQACPPAGSTAPGNELIPTAWGAFGDGHDYSRTGKHLPERCRQCMNSRPVLDVLPLRDKLTAIINAAFDALDANLTSLPNRYADKRTIHRESARQKSENRRIEALHLVDSAVLNWALESATTRDAVDPVNRVSSARPRATEVLSPLSVRGSGQTDETTKERA